MNHLLRFLFFLLIVRPIVLVVLGMHVRRREMLPKEGPAVIVANHNSHLDTMALISLYPLKLLPKLRPVAAADYFMKRRPLAWFATRVVGIIPINREVEGPHDDPLAGPCEALDRGEIVIVFPEGGRGEPEKMESFKTGVAHLAKRRPDVPITPVFIHGLGKALPKGEALLVPFFCDIFVGQALKWAGRKGEFMERLNCTMHQLAEEGRFQPWD